ncbi:MAG: 4-hydroxythreonine-4-phosphate dehydrogenase PdxA [Pseudomonadota bacterium]
MTQPLPLAVTMGDPAGCGPQITDKAWTALKDSKRPFYVVSSQTLYDVPTVKIDTPEQAIGVFKTALPVLELPTAIPVIETGHPRSETAPSILGSIEIGVRQAQSGQAAAIVTNPISKALLYNAGFQHPGHTEFIADLCRPSGEEAAPKPIMMLAGGGLRVALATIHVPLAHVPDLITEDLLIETGRIVHRDLQRKFGLASPRIAFTGLNPHAGEAGTIGREEVEIINPAAESLRSEGIAISDARPGDTVFHEALQGHFDAVIAMTHDQGLIPVKTLDMWGGVNTTLGLPIIRTSPDHGTAYEAAANGTARADSVIAALKLASQMAEAAGL